MLTILFIHINTHLVCVLGREQNNEQISASLHKGPVNVPFLLATRLSKALGYFSEKNYFFLFFWGVGGGRVGGEEGKGRVRGRNDLKPLL